MRSRNLRGEADQVAISFTDDPRAYPNESPATNDDGTLQFFLLYGAILFCTWQRDAKGAAVAWSNTIEGEKYVGARALPPR